MTRRCTANTHCNAAHQAQTQQTHIHQDRRHSTHKTHSKAQRRMDTRGHTQLQLNLVPRFAVSRSTSASYSNPLSIYVDTACCTRSSRAVGFQGFNLHYGVFCVSSNPAAFCGCLTLHPPHHRHFQALCACFEDQRSARDGRDGGGRSCYGLSCLAGASAETKRGIPSARFSWDQQVNEHASYLKQEAAILSGTAVLPPSMLRCRPTRS